MPARAAAPFVGRADELARLRGLIAAGAREPSCVIVAGEAGVGKSRLVTEALRPIEQRGAIVLRGECIASSHDVIPLAPVLEALRGLLRDLPQGPARQLLRSLVTSTGPGASTLTAEARGLATLDALFEASGGRRLVIVIDDLQWADAATLAFAEHIALNVSASRMTLVASMRVEAGASRPAARTVGRLLRRAQTELIELLPLDRVAVGELVAHAWGEEVPTEVVERIHGRSGGIPFYVEAILAQGDRAARMLPQDIRLIVSAEIEDLPADERRIVDVLAETVEPTDALVLASAAGVRRERAARVVASLAERGLVSVSDERLTVRHPLIREVIAAGHDAPTARRIHASLAGPLRAAAAAGGTTADAAEALALAAHHAARADDGAAALRDHLASARAALAAGRADLSAQQGELAVRLVRRDPTLAAAARTTTSAVELLAARALSSAGRPARALDILGASMPEGGDGDVASSVRAGVFRMVLLGQLGETAEAARVGERLLEAVGDRDERLRCRALNALASCYLLLGRPAEVRRLGSEADAVAGRSHDPRLRLEAASNLGYASVLLGPEADALRLFHEGAELVRSHAELTSGWGRDPVESASSAATWNIGFGLAELGELEAALTFCLDVSVAAGCGTVLTRECRMGEATAVTILHRLGRWAEAALRIRRLMSGTEPNVAAFGLIAHARILAGSGRFGQAEGAIGRARRESRTWDDPLNGPWLSLAEAELARWEGRRERVRSAVARGVAVAGKQQISLPNVLELHALRLAVEPSARAGDGTGEVSGVTSWRDAAIEDAVASLPPDGELRPEGLRATLAALIRTEIDRLRGDDSPDAWADVAARWTRMGCRLDVAYALYREAGSARLDDRRRAVDVLVRAHDLARQLPARPLARSIERAGARFGIELGRGQRDAVSEPGAVDRVATVLTEREREVAALIVRGASNREIATELLITEKTASIHVSNILGKLGARRRGEVAALVRRSEG